MKAYKKAFAGAIVTLLFTGLSFVPGAPDLGAQAGAAVATVAVFGVGFMPSSWFERSLDEEKEE